MSYKRLTPCIFIRGGKAVKWFDDRTVVSDDVVELAKQYSEKGADELIVFDLSDSDEEHDESIDLIKKIHRVISIPMIAGGNIRRTEDPLCRRKAGCTELLKAAVHRSDRGSGEAVRKRAHSGVPQ